MYNQNNLENLDLTNTKIIEDPYFSDKINGALDEHLFGIFHREHSQFEDVINKYLTI